MKPYPQMPLKAFTLSLRYVPSAPSKTGDSPKDISIPSVYFFVKKAPPSTREILEDGFVSQEERLVFLTPYLNLPATLKQGDYLFEPRFGKGEVQWRVQAIVGGDRENITKIIATRTGIRSEGGASM